MLAFAHHVPDVAEHEQIAGDRARQARDIVGVSGHEPAGEASCKMRRRVPLGNGIAHPPRNIVAKDNVFLRGEFDKAAREIGVVGGKRRLDVLLDGSLVVPQSRIELEIGENSRIVLRCQNGAGVARMRPQQYARQRAYRHANQSQTDPRPFHPEKPSVFASLKMVCRF